MAPLAISLGLAPPDPLEAARVPKRGQVGDFLQDDHSIPTTCIYVGRGHHSHRLPISKWKTPVVPGHDCPPEEWMARYVDQKTTTSSSSRKRAGKLVAAIAASRVVTVSSSRLPVQPFLQESVVLAFRKFYPERWLEGHKFPMLEDLINQPPFTCYLEWRANNDLSWDGPLQPMLDKWPNEVSVANGGREASRSTESTYSIAPTSILWIKIQISILH